MRSPGWIADIEMWVVEAYWAPEKCGRLTRPARHARAGRPGQSAAFGTAAPQTAGVPSGRCASPIAAPAPPLTDGGGPVGADGAEPPPPPPLRPPPPVVVALACAAAAWARA